MNKPKIVFMGSPEFALPTLKSLAALYPVAGVVTQPDRPAGRGKMLTSPPIKRLALELGLEVIQPRRLREPDAIERLRGWAPDLIIVAAFGQILRAEVLDLPELGCVNVHASLLPRWRGAAPISAAILHGDALTGVTIMKMDPGIDTGPMFCQRSTAIGPKEMAGELSVRLAELGAGLLIDMLPGYLSGEIQPQPQPAEGASYAPLLKKEDGQLDFSQPAESLARRVRAMTPWPGAYLEWDGGALKVLQAHAVSDGPRSPGGQIETSGRRTVVQGQPAFTTGAGILILDEVQPPGKKPMAGKAFLAGARRWSLAD